MIVDDRLETVLRTTAAGKTAARTQLRQLLDLLGHVPLSAWSARHASGLARLESLCSGLTDEETAAVLRAVPHRSAVLVYHFAQGGHRTAAAAVASADLSEEDWLALIPRLPVTARGFVRHRPGLPQAVRKLLSDLGVNDFLLPEPERAIYSATAQAPEPPPPLAAEPILPETPSASPPPAAPSAEDGIGAIVRRIEAFRRKRDERDTTPPPRTEGLAPQLPFVDAELPAPRPPAFVDLRTDADGVVVHATIDPPGMLIGARVFSAAPEAPLRCDEAMAQAFRQRQPVERGRITVIGADAVSGVWYADGPPLFARDGGRFTGYNLRLRRPLHTVAATDLSQATPPQLTATNGPEADRMRQLLHELRTPINAIQGFAEMIQSQVFGPTPHQYRAMAATIAADAAQMLAGFEEVERLVKLESHALALDSGGCDAAAVVARLVDQVSPVLAARNVRLTVAMPPQPLAVALAETELERSVWRLLSVIAASVAPGERLSIGLEAAPAPASAFACFTITLPAALQRLDDDALFAPDAAPAGGPLAAAAMLGNGFALRLARAELRAGGGRLRREDSRLIAEFPRPAANSAHPSNAAEGA